MEPSKANEWTGGEPPHGDPVDILAKGENGMFAMVNVDPQSVDWDGSAGYEVLTWKHHVRPTDEYLEEMKRVMIATMNSSLKIKR